MPSNLPILRNSLWNASGYGVGVVMLILVTPVYLHLLGLDQFGLFTLLTSLAAPLGILNAGMTQATTKYVAEFVVSGERQKAINVVHTTLLFNIALASLGCVTLWIASDWAATHFFNIPNSLIGEAIWAFKLTGAIWVISQIAGTFQAAVLGLQDFRALALGSSLQQLLMYGGGVLVLSFEPRLSALLYLNFAINTAAVAFWYVIAKRRLSGLLSSVIWDSHCVDKTVKFSVWQMLNFLVAVAANHSGRLMLGVLTNTAMVGIYGVAANIQNRLTGIVWSVVGTLFPAASSLSRQAGVGERFILEKGWTISILAGCFYGSIFVLGPDLLYYWVGAKVATQAAPVLMVLMSATLVALPSAIIYQYLLGMGLTKAASIGNLATSVVTVITSLLLILQFGLLGAAWGILAGLLLTRPAFHWWIFHLYFRPAFSLDKCFLLLYGAVFSTIISTGIAMAFHKALARLLGPALGVSLSCFLTPCLMGTLIFLFEKHIMGHSILLSGLVHQIKHWIVRQRQKSSFPQPTGVDNPQVPKSEILGKH